MASKTWLVTRREYLQRIRSKGFIIATILGPIGFLALMVIPVLIAVFVKDTSIKTVAVVDQTGVLYQELSAPAQLHLEATNLPVDSLRRQVEKKRLDGYLILPEGLLTGSGEALYYSRGTGGMSLRFELQGTVREAVRERRIMETGAPEQVLSIIKDNVGLRMVRLTDEGEAADSTALMSGIGYAMGFIIYFCVFIYGSLVMSGVIEEKTSRIVEIMASSVRPFQLMLGKVLGIGAMGMTQLLIWMAFGLGLLTFSGTIAMFFLDPAALGLPDSATQEAVLDAAGISIPQLHPSVVIYFVLFFLGGYLLYSSLFAAVGSAVEKESDAQQLTLPISLPVIIPVFFIFHIVDSPDSTLSVGLSLFPFFSPILMVVRSAVTVVPVWQTVLALALLFGTFLIAIWFASRIYRVGILMYGKRPSFKDLVRWARQA